jgi:DNA-directed RNA polymerase specialized sigma24 family protein
MFLRLDTAAILLPPEFFLVERPVEERNEGVHDQDGEGDAFRIGTEVADHHREEADAHTEDDAALVQQYRDGASFATLAATFGRSENAVISRLVRLRAGLRENDAAAKQQGSPFNDDYMNENQ